MQRPKPKTNADQDAALFATSCMLLARWLNVAEARRMAANEATRAAVEKAEAEVREATKDFVALPISNVDNEAAA